jgi:hypothetical protein
VLTHAALAAAHCKASMFGSSVSIPISNGRLNLGTWQVRRTAGKQAATDAQLPVAAVLHQLWCHKQSNVPLRMMIHLWSGDWMTEWLL